MHHVNKKNLKKLPAIVATKNCKQGLIKVGRSQVGHL